MLYDINISYRTGDSFHTRDAEDTIGLKTDDLNVAKECLQRIKEHYAFYCAKDKLYVWRDWYNKYPEEVEERKKLEKIVEDAKSKPWYVVEYDSSIILTVDGKPWQISAFWCGYFERLYGAEIVGTKDADMSFTVDG